MAGTTTARPWVPPYGRGTATFPSCLTGRSHQGFNVTSILPFLDLTLPSRRARTIRMFFKVQKVPRTFNFGVFGSSLVVALYSLFQILSRSNVIGAVFLRLDDVNEVRHG